MKQIFVMFMVLFCVPLVAQTVVTEDFNTGTLTASGATEVTLPSGIWTFYQTSSSTGVTGNCVKLNSSSSSPGYIVTPAFTTIATVSFYAKAGSSGKTMTIQKSVNGEAFVDVAVQTLTSSFAQYTITLNDTARNIRIKFMNTPGSGTSEYIDNVAITTLSSSYINLSTAELPSFGGVVSNTVSQSLSYTVSGNFLSAPVTITAPASFEVSLDNVSFGSSLSLVPSDSTLSPTTVYVRYVPTAAVGSESGTIEHRSEGALTRYLTVSGVALAAEPTVQPSVSVTQVTGTTITLQISGGNGGGVCVVCRPQSEVSFVPTDGEIYTGINQNFSAASDVGSGQKIVYKGSASSVTITGLSPATLYSFAVYAFNEGVNNSTNYLAENASHVSVTTSSDPSFIVTPAAIDFGNVVQNNGSIRSYTLTGNFLSPESGIITITAPEGYELSLSNTENFSATLQINYSASTLPATQIFVKFLPTETKIYSGSIVHSGGSAPEESVHVTGKGVAQVIVADQPVGFAALAGGVTGGAGGQTVIATNASELAGYLNSNEPLIVWISGTIDISGMITLRSNKTILGMGSDARIRGGGFEMNRYSNVIIRNVTFENSPDDCMKINQNSHHIWVDHCTFLDGPTFDPNSSHDGLFDITRQSDYITISYCLFYNHSKTMLIGHSDGATDDAGYLRTTIHHNWFKGTEQRHPRVRFGSVHTFNNFYDGNTIYGVASACNAKVVVEANYFKNVAYPIHVGYDASPWGYVNEINNIYENCGTPVTDGRTGYKGTPVTNPHTWNPASEYDYVVDNPADIPSIVMAQAGAGKIILGVENIQTAQVPETFAAISNYPNPFNPSTTIQYTIRTTGFVSLKVYDVLGREVATLVQSHHTPGSYAVQWQAQNQASGIYFSVLQQGTQRSVCKMMLAK